MPTMEKTFSAIVGSRRAACAAIETWSSWLAEVGIEFDARRISALLVLRDESGRRHLGEHEARVEPRVRRQEGRQAAQRRIDQHGDPPLGERPDLAKRERDHVGGESNRLGVKVAARQRLVVLGEDERIVGDGVRFVGERRRGLTQEVERGAHHLGLAAQAIGVLNPRIAEAVGGADLAAGDERPQGLGSLALAAMPAQGMDARVERRIRAARGVERQSAGRERRAKQGLGLEQADERVRRRELRAVEQREPLLRLERERLEPNRGQRFGRRHDAIVEESLADADHGGGHMGERREVARSADRALRGNDRRHAAVEHRADAIDRPGRDAGGALPQAAEFQRHHEPRDGNRNRLADAGGMR